MRPNRRESYRIEQTFEAELFHEGRVVACQVLDFSAGGARVESPLEMQRGTQCTLGLRLEPALAREAGVDYLSFMMEVLDAQPRPHAQLGYRLRTIARPGTKTYERAMRTVLAAQRMALARESDAAGASPMVSDEERRSRFRVPFVTRFTKGSLRPGQHADD